MAFYITIVELEGHPVLRITVDGENKDYWLRRPQARMLLRQLAEILTREEM